ncbi:MAG: hypothetical protein IPK64_08100 [bacterium]|nr:hypothetical protein [bacterium]
MRRRGAIAAMVRRGAGALGALLAVLHLAWAVPSVAAGLRRLDSAWLLPGALHDVLLGPAPTAPTAPTATGGPWLRAAQSTLYGLPELPVRLLAIGAAGRRWAAEAGWEILGGDALRDSRLTARGSFGDRWRVGLWASRRTVRLGAGEAGQALACDLEVMACGTHPAVGTWIAALQWPVFRSADNWIGAEPETRLRAALAAPGRAVSLSLDVGEDGSPAFGWEAMAGLGGGLGLAWRSDRASGAVGGGLVWRRGRVRVRTSHLAHPELGLTHRAEICVGTPGGAPW